MLNKQTSDLTNLIRDNSHALTGAPSDYDPLIQQIGEARFVLIGEASHGTHEFYRERAQITKRLIRERGFTAVAVEADWPKTAISASRTGTASALPGVRTSSAPPRAHRA